jgi:hypothetical protein
VRAQFFILLLFVLATGCAGVSTLGTPKSLAKGQEQYVVAPELNGGGPRRTPVPAPEMSFGYRRGVGHGVEIDGKLSSLPLGKAFSTLGVEVVGKYQFYDEGRLTMSVALGTGYRLIHSMSATWEGIYGNLPLLVGVRLRDRDQLVFGPRVGVQEWYSSGAHPVTIPFGGMSVGYAWAATENLTVFPELSWMLSPTTFQDRPEGTSMATFGVGFLFGHGR